MDSPQSNVDRETSTHGRVDSGVFLDLTPAPLLSVDGSLQVLTANQAATDMLGELREGSDLLTGFREASRPAVLRMIEDVKGRAPVQPVAARTIDDRLVDVNAFLMEANEPIVIGVMLVDRSSIDETERRLRDQEERYRSLFEWAPFPMRESDVSAVGAWLDELRRDGVVDIVEYMDEHPEALVRAIKSIKTTRVNAATVELLKAPSVDAVMQGFRDSELTPQILESFRDQVVTMWAGGTEYEADFLGIDFNNEPFECRLRWVIPSSSSGPDLTRAAVSFVDTTELRAAQRRLERLVAEKDRFVASVSHELRTPLAAVLGISEELHSNWESFDVEEIKDLIGVVATESADISLLVEDLLLAANVERGRVTINSEVFELTSIARDAHTDCARSNPDIADIEVAGSPVSVLADPARVRQVVRNLITNAVRYGGDNIAIECGIGELPYIRVIDDGDGIAPEHRESIFEPYFQADDEHVIQGSLGLGLSISRELARRMGGDLSYEYVDNKSVFTLELPPA